MNTIKPKYYINQNKRGINKLPSNSVPFKNPSFKSVAAVSNKVGHEVTTIIKELDKPIMQVFAKYYGDVGDRVGRKIGKIYNGTKKAPKLARFNFEKGISTIREKNRFEALSENILFPFTKLPMWTANWGLKKAQGIDKLSKKATELYKNDFFRDPRKIHELDEKTDIIKGMYEKTEQLVKKFAKEHGIESDELIKMINSEDPAVQASEIVSKADDYIRENLYKVSNKFFDKYTGNFNTAYERPLNRIVSGMIPVAFLANDAYNLSVLCGDSKEESNKEAKERQKQEISRVFTTAYIQLLMFGAFTKEVNTNPLFVPLVSAATVLFSETSSRARLGKPIFFLSKEKAKEYNKKQKEKELLEKQNPTDSTFKGKIENLKNKLTKKVDKSDVKQLAQSNSVTVSNEKNEILVQSQSTNVLENNLNNKSNSFKAQVEQKVENKENKTEKKPQKTLITMDTFKKGLAILTIGGFVLSFIKNSTWTKNSALMKTIKGIGNEIKEKIYNPLAFKDFEFSTKKFNTIISTLENVKFKQVADGHSFIKDKYAKEVKPGIFKVFKSKLPSEKVDDVVAMAVEDLQKFDSFNFEQVGTIKSTAKKVLRNSSTNITENAFAKVSDEIVETLDKNGIKISNASKDEMSKILAEAISQNTIQEAVKVETKIKPFVDIFTEPFKFVVSIGSMPYKIVSSALKSALSPLTNKIAKAEASGAPLTKAQKVLKRAMKEVFGEKSSKPAKTSQDVLVNAIENLDKSSKKYLKYTEMIAEAEKNHVSSEELAKLVKKQERLKEKLVKHVGTSIEKSFNGVTQSSNKNTDLAMLSKLASSLVTSAFLVADNYNMVMIKSDGEDKENAKEKAYERIIQRLSALFYQTMFINLFNSTFRSTYNSSLKGMAAVVAPNTITTEVVTRASIGMPIKRKTYDEIVEQETKNENRKGFLGKYFKFMRLLTGKKPLSQRLPKNKSQNSSSNVVTNAANIVKTSASTNVLEQHLVNKK